MPFNQLSSGDLIADRRAEYAHMLADTGDHAGAAELMIQALDLAPDWPSGWFRLADYQEKSGSTEAAIDALQRVLALNIGDMFGAALKLAILAGTPAPDRPSSLYVAQLFDDYAGRFDTSLVKGLAYTVPEKLAELIFEHARDEVFAHVVDLGCGTGLFGERIRDRAGHLEGFDLSSNMLAKAAGKGIYDRLALADLSLPPEACGLFSGDPFAGGVLSGGGEKRADLVSAADVLMYLGDLDNFFAIVVKLLAEGGLLAFSVEEGDDDADITLRPSLRYAHSPDYVRRLCAVHGLALSAVSRTDIRNDGGKPVAGILFLARKTA